MKRGRRIKPDPLEHSMEFAVATLPEKSMRPADSFVVSGYFADVVVCTPPRQHLGASLHKMQ